LGTGQAIGAHTGTDAIEAGVGADGPARIHTDTGSGGIGWAKGGDRAACVMPGWAGITASILLKLKFRHSELEMGWIIDYIV